MNFSTHHRYIRKVKALSLFLDMVYGPHCKAAAIDVEAHERDPQSHWHELDRVFVQDQEEREILPDFALPIWKGWEALWEGWPGNTAQIPDMKAFGQFWCPPYVDRFGYPEIGTPTYRYVMHLGRMFEVFFRPLRAGEHLFFDLTCPKAQEARAYQYPHVWSDFSNSM